MKEPKKVKYVSRKKEYIDFIIEIVSYVTYSEEIFEWGSREYFLVNIQY